MKPNLSKYANMKICVAVSGGRDSMALLHYLYLHGKEYGITLSALNCDHKIRGESSARDSAFVKAWCADRSIPLAFFEWNFDGEKTESGARKFRLECYRKAVLKGTLPNGEKWEGADAVATAHHLNDNAETVIFNLSRGSALTGLEGITDIEISAGGVNNVKIIRPLISCTRAEIDEYVLQNGVKFVDDETNFTDNYTRNKIRHNVLPELESAVPGAAEAIYRFSRLAAETERYFEKLIAERGIIKYVPFGVKIKICEECAVFKRAAVKVIKQDFDRCDYTAEHADRLYNLQFAENGKKFGFLGLTAIKEEGGVVICENAELCRNETEIPFYEFLKKTNAGFCGETLYFANGETAQRKPFKTLKFDLDLIPERAQIRFMKEGDFFKKFGGGTKNLGDFFTDRKIPLRVRKRVPVVADGSEILIVCGVEISDKIKITDRTKKIGCLICADYASIDR